MSAVPFIDLGRAHEPLQAELAATFDRIARSGAFTLGEELEEFERSFADVLRRTALRRRERRHPGAAARSHRARRRAGARGGDRAEHLHCHPRGDRGDGRQAGARGYRPGNAVHGRDTGGGCDRPGHGGGRARAPVWASGADGRDRLELRRRARPRGCRAGARLSASRSGERRSASTRRRTSGRWAMEVPLSVRSPTSRRLCGRCVTTAVRPMTQMTMFGWERPAGSTTCRPRFCR